MNQRKAGIILSYLTMGAYALVSLIYVPMLLSFLTKEQYGLYQLVGSMVAYIAIMDFGLANTTIRYYSRFRAQQDIEKQENLLATMLYIYVFVAGLIVITGIVLLYVLLPFYRETLSLADLTIAKHVYWIMLLNLVIVIPGNIFVAIIQTHEKFIFQRSINLLNVFIQPLLVYIILHFQANIMALVLVQTLCNFGIFCLNAYYAICKLKVRFQLHQWDGKFVKEILFFSFFIFLNAIMDQIYWKSGQLILGAVVGTVAVAIYSITTQLCLTFMNFSGCISGVFLPHLSKLETTGSMQNINEIFIKVGRVQFYIVMLIFCGFILFGKQFLSLWVGPSFSQAYIYTVILMGALIMPLVENTGILVLQAKNKHAFRAIVFVLIAILNIAIAIPLAKYYGAMACASVTAGCLLLGQGLILNIYYAKLGIAVKKFLCQIGKILGVISIVVFGAWFVLHYASSTPSAWILGAQVVLFTIVYGFVMWLVCMNEYEKNLILIPIKKILKQ